MLCWNDRAQKNRKRSEYRLKIPVLRIKICIDECPMNRSVHYLECPLLEVPLFVKLPCKGFIVLCKLLHVCATLVNYVTAIQSKTCPECENGYCSCATHYECQCDYGFTGCTHCEGIVCNDILINTKLLLTYIIARSVATTKLKHDMRTYRYSTLCFMYKASTYMCSLCFLLW